MLIFYFLIIIIVVLPQQTFPPGRVSRTTGYGRGGGGLFVSEV